MEDEEDRICGLIRPIGSAGVTLQQIEQSGGDLIPVVEGPLRGVSRRVMTGTREGLDRGLDVQEILRLSSPRLARPVLVVAACASDVDVWRGCPALVMPQRLPERPVRPSNSRPATRQAG